MLDLFGFTNKLPQRQMRQNLGQPPMTSQNPHGRKDSHHSMHDPNIPPQGSRGGYHHGSQRGSNRNYFNQGPGFMAPNFPGRGGPPNNRGIGSPYSRQTMPYLPNANQSPRPAPDSLAPISMPPGSPVMGSTASPAMGHNVPFNNTHYQPGPPGSNFPPHAMQPNVQYNNSIKSRRKNGRHNAEKFSQHRQSDGRRTFKESFRSTRSNDRHHEMSGGNIRDPSFWGPFPDPGNPALFPQDYDSIDLAPTNPNVNRVLTGATQQYPGPYMHTGYNPGMHSYNNYSVPQAIPQYQPQVPPAPGYGAPPENFTPNYRQQQQQNMAEAQSMSRQNSAMSHTGRPGSSGPPPIAQDNPIAHGSHTTAPPAQNPIVSGNNRELANANNNKFVFPVKKTPVLITNERGEALDFRRQLRASTGSSPAQASAHPKPPPTKGPAVASDTKPGAAPVEPAAQAKTDEEKKKEFAEAVAAKKAKEEADAKAEVEAKVKADAQAAAKAKEEFEAKAAAEAKAKAEEEARVKAEAEAKAREEAEAAAKAKQESQKAATPAPKPRPTLAELEAKGFDNLSPEEQELMLDLIDEADAQREAEQDKISAQKKVEQEAAKARAEDRLKNVAEEDRKLREAEAEAERLEAEKERRREERAARGENTDALKATIDDLKIKDKVAEQAAAISSVTNKTSSLNMSKNASVLGSKTGSQRQKPAALILQPLKTANVEAPQPSAALQSLKSARFLQVMTQDIYPDGIKSPNPAVNPAARGKSVPFRYDMNFMLQFQNACKEPPSIDFQQQVKNLIGDEGGNRSASAKAPSGSGRPPSRASTAFSAHPMGSFHQYQGRALNPDLRMPMPHPPIGKPPSNPLAFPNRPGLGPTGMVRNPSGTGMHPNSPRTGSRRGDRSKRSEPHAAKQEAKANAAMPLTQGLDVKPIATSATGWKPLSVGRARNAPGGGGGGENGLMDPPMVQRKVKAALNKMTPEKFDRLADQILEIASQSKEESDGRTLRQVIQLVFEKATDEAHWSGMYARFCRRMLDTMDSGIRDESIRDKNGDVVSGGALFRKYLLNRCQEDFERGWKVDLPQTKEGEGDAKKVQEAALLSDEYYVAAGIKRRGLGLIQFIGELFKLGMLTERIMHECVHKLLDFEGAPDEAEIESLCKLLKTVGGPLDSTEKSRVIMDVYFSRIDTLINTNNLPSRMKFMLMDVVDLRKAKWCSADHNKGPKTLDEIRTEAEAQAAQKQAEAARNNQRGGGGRPPAGRGDARNFPQGYGHQSSTHVGMDDLRRLKGSANRSSTHNMSLAPSTLLQSRSNSGRSRLGPGGSLNRANDDGTSGSRTGTPVQQRHSSNNAFA